MKTKIENVEVVKKINGHGNEIIQVFDKEAFNGVSKGLRLFTTLTSTPDEEIVESVNFEIDADQDTRDTISKMIINLKN